MTVRSKVSDALIFNEANVTYSPDRSRSLQELEGTDWGDPDPNDTDMVQRIHSLRRKPLSHLSDEELRLAVSQQVGTPHLLEIALDRLTSDPLLECEHYPGDLLAALVRLDESEWVGRPDLKTDLAACFQIAIERPDDDTDALRDILGLPGDPQRIN